MSLDDAKPPRRRKANSAPDGMPPADHAQEAPAAAQPVIASPTRTFRLPSGRTMTISTDRVRAAPAISPQLSFVLGQNAIGLGLWGLLAPKGVNRFLGLRSSVPTTQLLFGAREMATGMALFSDPTRAGALWARAAGRVYVVPHLEPSASGRPRTGCAPRAGPRTGGNA